MQLISSNIKESAASGKKVVNFKAELAHNNSRYFGYIGNLSEESLYMITFPTSRPLKLTPGEELQVRLDPPARDAVCLHCRVTWAYKTPPHGLTQSIGLEIVDSFPNYEDLLNNLY